MPVKHYKIILILFLIGVSMFSIVKYALVLKEKYDLLDTLEQTKKNLEVLANEKQNLLQEIEKEKDRQQKLQQENSGLKDNLRSKDDEITKLKTDYAGLDASLEDLNSKYRLLKTENIALRQDKDNLKFEVGQVSQEKEGLLARLSSIAELKKAIKELRMKMRHAGTVRVIKAKKAVKQAIETEGNRGFIVKEGKATYPAKVIIEVNPAPFK